MKQQIHINDQGELLLIEAPDKEKFKVIGIIPGITYEATHPDYQAALTSAIEKGIRFAPDDVPKLVNLLNTDRSLSFNINDHKGKLFDLPNSYTAEVKWYNYSVTNQ